MPGEADRRARELEQVLEAQAAGVELPSFNELVTRIRVYLLRHNRENRARNNVQAILKSERSGGIGSITLGPQIDKGSTPLHYHTRSGARLSFAITVREEGARCSLVTYRFHIQLRDRAVPGFFRFDLNESSHSSPLHEPRSHLHSGRDDIRLPVPVLDPPAILDRIFHVIDAGR